MNDVLQQGEADGLCGLYCILNYLRSIPDWRKDTAAESMQYVLIAVQAEGLLTAEYLTKGFQEYQIVSILNRIFSDFLMGLRAVQLKEIERVEGESWFDFYMRLVAAGGSIIGGPKGRDHWVLVTEDESGPVILNSADRKTPKRFDRRQRDYCDQEGVVILPFERQLIKV